MNGGFLESLPRIEFIKPPRVIVPPPVEIIQAAEIETPPLLNVGINFSLDTSHYIKTGEKDFICAMTGMGKSYLGSVLLEQTLENKITICAIDPHGEMYTLKERYPVIIVGGEHADILPNGERLELSLEKIPKIIKAMLTDGISTIFDISDIPPIPGNKRDPEFVYFGLICKTLFDLEKRYKFRMRLVIEEAQLFAPQGKGDDECVAIMKRIAKEGRKFGIDSVHLTQRFASVSKDIISQCNRKWIGRMESEQDLEAVAPVLREAKIDLESVKKLQPGQFYLYTNGTTTLVQVAKRKCTHGGMTPELKRSKRGGKKEIDQLLSQLA